MKRRDFMEKAGCGLAALLVAADISAQEEEKKEQEKPKRARYKIEFEVYEAREDSSCHKKGDKFEYPGDWGKVCPWLRGSMNDVVRLLQFGVTLPWKYEGTPYEKVIDPDGITTEYVSCPDPTANLVMKIIRTKIS
ncbi:MAG: hypothetical protein A2Y62_07060 [Candidatus Fischerbacteria bacterium RBG_13_37_8]|uniref:TIGR04076 family protein n=1 Tax=Candidatus Fischerbacteria bacterium RBG_13_37_8 TaxID=1817863 RepID=A0A1F5V9D2_9BACT|nr:MAG: hypothetical protein A2Y62_07060 [Candidatus Fischerbacteria bacterium RBG_13_37_8]